MIFCDVCILDYITLGSFLASSVLKIFIPFVLIFLIHLFLTLCLVNVQKEEEFVFSDISERPVPSLFRGFSAPVRVETDLSNDDLFFLLAHDSDEFNRYVPFYNILLLLYALSTFRSFIFLNFRWEAGQVLARKLMLNLVSDYQQNKPLVLNPKFVKGLGSVLSDSSLDKVWLYISLSPA